MTSEFTFLGETSTEYDCNKKEPSKWIEKHSYSGNTDTSNGIKIQYECSITPITIGKKRKRDTSIKHTQEEDEEELRKSKKRKTNLYNVYTLGYLGSLEKNDIKKILEKFSCVYHSERINVLGEDDISYVIVGTELSDFERSICCCCFDNHLLRLIKPEYIVDCLNKQITNLDEIIKSSNHIYTKDDLNQYFELK